jgi:hypothetical protein
MKEMECRRVLHTWIETLHTCSLEFRWNQHNTILKEEKDEDEDK